MRIKKVATAKLIANGNRLRFLPLEGVPSVKKYDGFVEWLHLLWNGDSSKKRLKEVQNYRNRHSPALNPSYLPLYGIFREDRQSYLSQVWEKQWELPICFIGSQEETKKSLGSLWLFDGSVFTASDEITAEDMFLLIKSSELAKSKKLNKLRKLVETSEKLEKAAKRQPISDDVQMFVWQRDGGKCVKCGSNESLEFDHIIPVSKGGANTARNLQLLCEGCNRSKSANIGG